MSCTRGPSNSQRLAVRPGRESLRGIKGKRAEDAHGDGNSTYPQEPVTPHTQAIPTSVKKRLASAVGKVDSKLTAALLLPKRLAQKPDTKEPNSFQVT